MKTSISAALIALVAGANLVTAGLVSGSHHHSWDDYCTEKGIWKDQIPHVCFNSGSDITGTINPYSRLSGFYSDADHRNFVVVYDTEEVATFNYDRWEVRVRFSQAGAGCPKVSITQIGQPENDIEWCYKTKPYMIP